MKDGSSGGRLAVFATCGPGPLPSRARLNRYVFPSCLSRARRRGGLRCPAPARLGAVPRAPAHRRRPGAHHLPPNGSIQVATCPSALGNHAVMTPGHRGRGDRTPDEFFPFRKTPLGSAHLPNGREQAGILIGRNWRRATHEQRLFRTRSSFNDLTRWSLDPA